MNRYSSAGLHDDQQRRQPVQQPARDRPAPAAGRGCSATTAWLTTPASIAFRAGPAGQATGGGAARRRAGRPLNCAARAAPHRPGSRLNPCPSQLGETVSEPSISTGSASDSSSDAAALDGRRRHGAGGRCAAGGGGHRPLLQVGQRRGLVAGPLRAGGRPGHRVLRRRRHLAGGQDGRRHRLRRRHHRPRGGGAGQARPAGRLRHPDPRRRGTARAGRDLRRHREAAGQPVLLHQRTDPAAGRGRRVRLRDQLVGLRAHRRPGGDPARDPPGAAAARGAVHPAVAVLPLRARHPPGRLVPRRLRAVPAQPGRDPAPDPPPAATSSWPAT